MHQEQSVYQETQTIERPLSLNIQRKKLEIIAVSDTHGNYKKLIPLLKMKGDIFIHAGDFTHYGKQDHFLSFFDFIDKLNFRYKIILAGNHEISLDNRFITAKQKQRYLQKYQCKMSREQIIRQIQKKAIYLEHRAITIEGINIFGSPHSPYYAGNAFQYSSKQQSIIWESIPKNIDLLITHCPPYGILDLSDGKQRAGSKVLRKVVFDRKPKYHIFGHIHQSVGMNRIDGINFLNVSNEPTKIII